VINNYSELKFTNINVCIEINVRNGLKLKPWKITLLRTL